MTDKPEIRADDLGPGTGFEVVAHEDGIFHVWVFYDWNRRDEAFDGYGTGETFTEAASMAIRDAEGEEEEDQEDGPLPVQIVSFGFGHGPVPEGATAVLDTRPFRNPHDDPTMVRLTGQDIRVRAHVLNTNGVMDFIHTNGLAAEKRYQAGELVHLAVGCVGGRHRSVAIAEALGRWFETAGIPAVVAHRDMDKPVIQRTEN